MYQAIVTCPGPLSAQARTSWIHHDHMMIIWGLAQEMILKHVCIWNSLCCAVENKIK